MVRQQEHGIVLWAVTSKVGSHEVSLWEGLLNITVRVAQRVRYCWRTQKC
jgi:hypothetical protein